MTTDISLHLRQMLAETPGAEKAYQTNAYFQAAVQPLDMQWKILMEVLDGYSAQARSHQIADKWLRTVLARYVDQAHVDDRMREALVKHLEMSPPSITAVGLSSVGDDQQHPTR
jgi:hypothetical protein